MTSEGPAGEPLGGQSRAGPSPVGLDAVRALLSAAPDASAVTVGIHRAGQQAFVATGTTTHHGDHPAAADTRFEVGSLTKTFTALLLAEQNARGEVALHDAAAHYLPAGTQLPAGGTAITLLHLATHTSGLPRLPSGLLRTALPRLLSNPYADFTHADLLDAFSRTRLRSRPGTRVRYSNFGVGLLGHLLCAAAGGPPYEELLAERILGPLALHHTNCTPDPAPHTAVTGHWRGRPRPPFDIPGLPAAGAVRSSARDLLTLTQALLSSRCDAVPATTPTPLATTPAPLRTALADVTRPRLTLPNGTGLALLWNTRTRPDGSTLYHHSGGTRGCTAFAGFSPAHDTALVALANSAPGHGNHLIQRAYEALLSLLPES
ncbi:serine hydrolase domain-containing protein [Streptomyces sp. NPDC047117]|uniref:serine hydrolase domain-containing protein n=1 Tax=Streptomyces sp. NPDC047117 TaxID=3155379 RepID=UPI0034008856